MSSRRKTTTTRHEAKRSGAERASRTIAATALPTPFALALALTFCALPGSSVRVDLEFGLSFWRQGRVYTNNAQLRRVRICSKARREGSPACSRTLKIFDCAFRTPFHRVRGTLTQCFHALLRIWPWAVGAEQGTLCAQRLLVHLALENLPNFAHQDFSRVFADLVAGRGPLFHPDKQVWQSEGSFNAEEPIRGLQFQAKFQVTQVVALLTLFLFQILNPRLQGLKLTLAQVSIGGGAWGDGAGKGTVGAGLKTRTATRREGNEP